MQGATIETLISTMGIRYLRFDGSGGTFSEQKNARKDPRFTASFLAFIYDGGVSDATINKILVGLVNVA